MTYNKYRAVKTVVDGITFHSKKEALRYQDLKLLEKAGEINKLKLQPRYDFKINDVNIGFYKGDFLYLDNRTGAWITEDCKGFKTPTYKLKKKLVKALYGIDIYET